ncbi:uncharacterized protein EI90DRAFT_3156366 [Cantharellus anzutake]|uniref:uncharacterized protein n=1 Tax=Cantharellus anzutake TaxID=1750568 RepID=UPI0019068389|nr:uncharacterized protein EI90DRAFT_3156366 [Cantharellus anzutake]KAF8326995.1 hypothetical protein EI90DRAFT_3156366 [Cantharellus anzutake]
MMPSLTSPAKVLVTGSNGFIAAWIVRVLIDRGYNVIGTVRSAPKGDYLKKQFGDKFEFVVAKNLEENAFDEAVKSTNPDAIIHAATPMDVSGDPQSVIGPAVEGTLGILRSAQQFGHNIKRIVITSSIASILESKDVPSYTFTEDDWNSKSEGIIEREGTNAPGEQKYATSKTKAEQAAWKFINENKGLHFDLTTILPSVVFGPIIHEVKDVSALNATIALFRHCIFNGTLDFFSNNFVDVRDVALAHVLALEVPEAGGERIIISSAPFFYQQSIDALIEARYKVPPREPREDTSVPHAAIMDNAKSKKILGINYRDFKETSVDTYAELQRRFPESFP